jgi:phosphoribosylanthranilate isomerase
VTRVKICGLTTPETVDAAIEAGADYLGFMLVARSPRALTVEQAAPLLARAVGRAKTVAVVVDPSDAMLAQLVVLAPDVIQLHGGETPERVAAVRRITGRPVIKVLPVAERADLASAGDYEAEHLMFDAKPAPGADRSGGHGVAFDWSLLSAGSRGRGERGGEAGSGAPAPHTPHPTPGLWFLAGGLNAGNVAEAIGVTGAPVVDVSSGVESAPGVKDPALIRAFIQAARNAS